MARLRRLLAATTNSGEEAGQAGCACGGGEGPGAPAEPAEDGIAGTGSHSAEGLAPDESGREAEQVAVTAFRARALVQQRTCR